MMKKRLAPALLALLIAGSAVIAGCGGASSQSTAPYDAPAAADQAYDYTAAREEAGGAYMSEELLSGSSAQVSLSDRKIIKNIYLSLETQEFDTAISEIRALVERMGGYVESSDITGTSLRDKGQYSTRYASFTARIPAEKLNSTVDELGSLCNIRNRSENVSDITDTYFDVDGRLNSLRVQEERLLSMMEQAEKLEDMITIESALADVRYEIESLTGQLNRMDSQVSYSTLNIDLSEVVEYTEQRIQPKTFGERVAETFADSLAFIRRFGQELVLFVVAALPVLVVYGGIVLIIVLIIRAIVKARRKKRAAQYEAMGLTPPPVGRPSLPPQGGPGSPHAYGPSQPGTPPQPPKPGEGEHKE